MRRSESVTANPVRFHRSNTIVTDVEVIIGMTYYSIQSIVGAQVRPVWGPIDWRRAIKSALLNLLMYVAFILAFSILQWSRAVHMAAVAGSVFVFMEGTRLLNRKFELRAPEYRLVLHTRSESKEVITANEKRYLASIAEEINRRVLNSRRQSNPYSTSGVPTRPLTHG